MKWTFCLFLIVEQVCCILASRSEDRNARFRVTVRWQTPAGAICGSGLLGRSFSLPFGHGLGRRGPLLVEDASGDLQVLVAKNVPKRAVERRPGEFACGNGPAHLGVADLNAFAKQTPDEISETHFLYSASEGVSDYNFIMVAQIAGRRNRRKVCQGRGRHEEYTVHRQGTLAERLQGPGEHIPQRILWRSSAARRGPVKRDETQEEILHTVCWICVLSILEESSSLLLNAAAWATVGGRARSRINVPRHIYQNRRRNRTHQKESSARSVLKDFVPIMLRLPVAVSRARAADFAS